MEPKPERRWLVPAAIIGAGVILAITVFVIRTSNVALPEGGNPDAIRPVALTDHIIGNPEAPVAIVEYSDIDSEFGKSFQAVLAQLMTEYAPSGNVAWVYRHFPLTTINPYSLTHAQAAECAKFLGTEDTFYRFIDAVNAGAPGAADFNPRNYSQILLQLGIPQGPFDECISSGRFSKTVMADVRNALGAGAEGAPFTVILIKGNDPLVINGALPYESMKEVIENSLAKVQ
ncbi:MAG TPA: thioredoxin domain-containing protein [Candidatus Paceibacterota bacterium]|nr:thioredoxin domain-containing protein [Candidatus Paceibacterota bacterium]